MTRASPGVSRYSPSTCTSTRTISNSAPTQAPTSPHSCATSIGPQSSSDTKMQSSCLNEATRPRFLDQRVFAPDMEQGGRAGQLANSCFTRTSWDIVMSLMAIGTIEIPDSLGTSFDHGAFEPETRRVFIAHTARDSLEVVDADASRHVATLRGFPEAAGVVAD